MTPHATHSDPNSHPLAAALQRHTTAEIRWDAPTRALYATDASHYQIMPLGVVLPRHGDDLLAITQLAAEHGVALIGRGGGTSLSGQSIGAGIIVDCSKYLNRVLDFDPSSRRIRIQPGMVLDHLNASLAPHGLMFGPDVATASRATLGGMIGNNSAGSRSLIYGKTADHVTALDTILSHGIRHRFEAMTPSEWERMRAGSSPIASIYRTIQRLIRDHADEIRRRFPHILRRVSGYNLAAYVDPESTSGIDAWRNHTPPSVPERADCSLVPLLVGSEGTLVLVESADLKLVPRPKFRGLLVPHFESLTAALEAVEICLAAQPSAVELMDSMLIDLARTQRSLKRAMSSIHGHPAALLMVEWVSDDAAEIPERIGKLARILERLPGCTAVVPAIEAAEREPLWNLRSSAVPLLYGMPGDRKPVTFVEDTAVSPEKLPAFATRFRAILREHGTDGTFYGHASVGCLHIRPVLNLKDPHDRQRMRSIMTAISDLVLEFGGALSGEHGDGLVRSEWNAKMYGPTIAKAFLEIKQAFDPANRFNPGKIVNAPPMEANLRPLPGESQVEPATRFQYESQGGFFRSIEVCNGAGVCRRTQGGAMCPSYRATRDEVDSTRGRANALRLALVGDGPNSPQTPPLQQRWVHEVLDLCLSCKACKAECPSNVDLTKLKAEFEHAYYQAHPRPWSHRLARSIPELHRWGAALAPITNAILRNSWLRRLFEPITGLDHRRQFPELERNHFHRWWKRRHSGGPTPASATSTRRVMLLADCFTSFTESRIPKALVRILEAGGLQVELAPLRCCGRAMLSKGYLSETQVLIQQQLPTLLAATADGTPILGIEPSCTVALLDEWPELIPGDATARLAQSVFLADDWLSREIQAGRLRLPLRESPQTLLLHGHCHQKAMLGTTGSSDLLRLIPQTTVHTLDVGCCGMAGMFGYERNHFDLSRRIAELQLLPALRAAPEAGVAATGTSCRHQIADFGERAARHPIEWLADALIDESAAAI
ncbi:FAD-binding and (Fe-S)-binding domain-containing protein [Tuwongella immobilis]|uniref:FAD-binding PCMH-type domain-containing protein n=1 Tax=Tuwongella immobilis TaxID=692036 RepID=A0A6C2YL89_9BACT|nr:FAD-binding and (Fe-S)-binding domain-containing protein [Tuwongella immobilis]VIP02196.1 fad-linked oxidase : FAD/FMN-dependent dehydrogenase OS=Singulisphaera acidiphila (strain ATCC BAA-1392 / DSM 18658 / VKM B-2454 / MOB10) GN=Sinac_0736 PE=4 SV=1: FAD_binding_4: FAD-oxidase_C: Fer4_8: CCG [Tuwongella immobilis]VTS00675.1 fad-linked oxidase : FAD/FMN-dependent dehydrogenase OS=Singulisphaera acidiphila (strain ATCC BAA-1392 / DSM 18658 / VKM B-2454 / MOB10) GN=Sinac_0736 PE=4 SV=1: FAD_bin